MSLSRHLLRRAPPPVLSLNSLSHFRNAFFTDTTDHIDDQRTDEFLPQEKNLNSWKVPLPRKEAEARFAMLGHEYVERLEGVRMEYLREIENLERLKAEEAKLEAWRLANQQGKAGKEAEKQAKAKARELAAEEYRQIILRERAERLRMARKQVEEKKKEKKWK